MDLIYVLLLEGDKYYVGKTNNLNRRLEEHFSGENSAEWTKLHRPVKVINVQPCNGDFDEVNVTKEYMSKFGIDNVRGGAYSNCTLSLEQKRLLEVEIRSAKGLCNNCGEEGHYANVCQRTDTARIAAPPANPYAKPRGIGHSKRDHSNIDEIPHAVKKQKNDCHRTDPARIAAAPPSKNPYAYHGGIGQSKRYHSEIEETPHFYAGKQQQKCSKCGHLGHRSDSCYARISVDGHQLSSSSSDSSDSEGDCCYRCGRPGHYAADCYARYDVCGHSLKRYR